MKKWLIIGGVLVAGGAAAHYAVWKQQVAFNNNALEQLVAGVNNNLGTKALELSYDQKLEGEAYPLKASVSYTNPVITVNPAFYEHQAVSSFYENLEGGAPVIDEIRVNGVYAINSDKLGNAISSTVEGAAIIKGSENGQSIAYAMKSDDTMRCGVGLARSPLSYIFKTHETKQGAQQLFDAINHLDCDTSNVIVTDETDSRVLSSWEQYDITVDAKDAGKQNHKIIDFQVQLDGLEYSQTQQQLLEDYEQAFAPLSDAQKSVFALLQKHPVPALSQSQAGKQNIALEGTYSGAVGEEALQRDDAAFDLHISTFDVSNALYDSSAPFSLMFNEDAIKLNYDGDVTYHPAFEAMLKDSIDAIIKIIHSPELQVDAELKKALMGVSKEQLTALVPQLSKLGRINMVADVSLPKKEGNIAINNLGFSAAPYRLMVNGQGNLSPINGELTIKCDACKKLLTNLLSYAGNLQMLARDMSLDNIPASAQSLTLTPELNKALVGFILNLDTTKDEKVTTITLKAQPETGITISDLPLMAVMIQGFATISPYLKQ